MKKKFKILIITVILPVLFTGCSNLNNPNNNSETIPVYSSKGIVYIKKSILCVEKTNNETNIQCN